MHDCFNCVSIICIYDIYTVTDLNYSGLKLYAGEWNLKSLGLFAECSVEVEVEVVPKWKWKWKVSYGRLTSSSWWK